MKKRQAVLITNPCSGRGRAFRAREVEQFRRCLDQHGVEVEVLNTTAPGDAWRLAEQVTAEGYAEVIVSGGDGTINEAVQGLVGTKAKLAVWPRGTSNVLARELRLPFDVEQAAAVIARGETRRIYPGCAVDERSNTRRYFLLMAGIGLDASVVENVSTNLKQWTGEAAFWYAGLGHLANWQPTDFRVEVNGETFPATFASIGKAAGYGGNLAITPGARCDVPAFEICVVDSRSRLRYLYLLSHAMRSSGVADGMPSVRLLNAPWTRAEGNAPVQVDGELIGRLPMRFEVADNPLEVIVPADSPISDLGVQNAD